MKKFIIIFSFVFLLFSCGNKKDNSGFSSSLDSTITNISSSEESLISEESLSSESKSSSSSEESSISEESLSSESESSSSEEKSGDAIDGNQLQTSWNW